MGDLTSESYDAVKLMSSHVVFDGVFLKSKQYLEQAVDLL